jgi:prophage regulatory protein
MAYPRAATTIHRPSVDDQQVSRAYRRLLKRDQVLERTGLSNSGMYELIARGLFPKPVKPTGARSSAWVEDEVDQFIASCIAQRDANEGAA